MNASERTRRELPSAGFICRLGKNKRINHGERAMPSLSGQVSLIGGQEAQLTGPGSRSSTPEAHTSFPLSAAHSTPSAILHYPARFSGIPKTHTSLSFPFFLYLFNDPTNEKTHTHTVDKRSFLFLRTREPCVCAPYTSQP